MNSGYSQRGDEHARSPSNGCRRSRSSDGIGIRAMQRPNEQTMLVCWTAGCANPCRYRRTMHRGLRDRILAVVPVTPTSAKEDDAVSLQASAYQQEQNNSPGTEVPHARAVRASVPGGPRSGADRTGQAGVRAKWTPGYLLEPKRMRRGGFEPLNSCETGP